MTFPVPVRARAFTLVEMVVVMTILAVLTAMAVPALTGLEKERAARAPVAELERLARTVRARAIAEQTPYQIGFDSRGFHAARYYNPYGEAEEFDRIADEAEIVQKQREIVEASRKRNGDLSGETPEQAEQRALIEALQAGSTYLENYNLPEGLRCEVRTLSDMDWVDVKSGLFKRWVFQPSGMCSPFKVRIQNDTAFFEVEFHPLTGQIRREKSWVE